MAIDYLLIFLATRAIEMQRKICKKILDGDNIG